MRKMALCLTFVLIGFIPASIGAETGWISLSSRYAVRTDGTLWVAGGMQIGTDANWAAVSAGISHGAGIRNDGSLWAWVGTMTGAASGGGAPREFSHFYGSTPVRIGTATNWVYVASGDARTMAIRADGSLWELRGNNVTRVGTTTNWA